MKARGVSMIRRCVFLAVGILAFGVVTASAFEGAEEEDLLFGASEKVITPARHFLTVSDAPASVTVITEDMIASSGAQSIPDLLREVPGLELFEASPTDVNVGARGYNGSLANKMLVMIDGRSVYEDFFGFVVWKTIPVSLDEIKQIEVVRGPGSAVYGANAYGGVIHIITKSPREMSGSSVLYRYGVEGDQEEVAVTRAGGSSGGTDYKSFLSWRRTGTLGEDAALSNPEGVRGSMTVARPVGVRSELSLSAGIDDGEGEANTGIGPFDYENTHLYVGTGFEGPEVRGRLYWNRTRDITYADLLAEEVGAERRDISTDLVNFDAQWNRPGFGGAYYVVGANARLVSFESELIDGTRDQTLAGVYGQVEKSLLGSTDLTLGVRLDEHPETGRSLSPRASLVHRFEGRRYVRLSVGEAYRSPTLLENYLDVEGVTVTDANGNPLPLPANAAGNPDLRNERIRSYEAAYGFPIRERAFLRVEGFRNENRDWILFKATEYYSDEDIAAMNLPDGVYLPGGVLPKTLSYENIYDVTCNGGEVAVDLRWNPDWQTRVGYSYVSYENRDALPEEFVFVPEHKVTARLTGRLSPSVQATVAGHYRSASTYGSDEGDVPAQATMDGAVRYDLRRAKLSAELSVQNAFDARYKEHPDGDRFGRRLYARLRYRF